MVSSIARLILGLYTLYFRLWSFILTRSPIFAYYYRQAQNNPVEQYNAQHLHGFLRLTRLYLQYPAGHSVFALDHHYHPRSLNITLSQGQWFHIILGDLHNDPQSGYAVLNRIVEWQTTQVVLELIAATGGWSRAEFILIAIDYAMLSSQFSYAQYHIELSTLRPNNRHLPLPPDYSWPEFLTHAAAPLYEAQNLPRLPYLPRPPLARSHIPYHTPPHLLSHTSHVNSERSVPNLSSSSTTPTHVVITVTTTMFHG
ncbi:hypothetical protein BDY19DRAFT_998488 [Irpex rosettiformis]|uniref:Uncharacterized protein n=1 Tax=Irpex rosettiformis TaxID=378272 RepID=A0ACB8TNH2_9APHY|nr:hypothetical protein BDY19DRAFT_998488 [Irpex rosettiformis]